jgi:hypothetical protein
MNISPKQKFLPNNVLKQKLHKRFYFLLLEKCICGGNPNERITNGENAKDHEFPFHVKKKKSSSNFFKNFSLMKKIEIKFDFYTGVASLKKIKHFTKFLCFICTIIT